MMQYYLYKSDYIMFVYDITNRESFEKVKDLINKLNRLRNIKKNLWLNNLRLNLI